MPNRPDANWPRLATFAKARREELGLTQRDVAVQARLSTNGYRAIEDGNAVRASTLEAAERGLRWAPGSAASILHGGEPTALPKFSGVGGDVHPAFSHYQIPPQLRAALTSSEVFDVEIAELANGHGPVGHVVLLGLVDRDLPDSKLMAAVRAFDEYKKAFEGRELL